MVALYRRSSPATCDGTGTILRAWKAFVITWLSVATGWLCAASPSSDNIAFVDCVLVILG
jgi:hypothetical protein